MATESARALLKRHELLAELQDVVARQLSDMGVAADTAALVAAFLVDYLSTYWAGQVVSFPKDAFYKLTLKELEVLSLFQGDNYDQLARQFGMTPRGMRKLVNRINARIKAQRAAEAAPGQMDAFGHAEVEEV
ncbi:MULTISPECIES: Mor transcription activator family protein [Acidovorax]|uniref:Uncharacterized protein n=1 Tax=Acidovorax carolinensis TaxID=553814 RepID=A0A240UA58_9BURK|nr:MULTISPECIES: Mor transcription activator family protein [Acidovorax]ART47585.1 hypothetical protein CBP33_05110 [Acidovorax carolinensis]ART55731.1 hypothetical protein CBP35_13385 [Acidovorax carolinensis]ART58401.1 hypothetical protein CBP36_05545 [Acidovorax carolinensis]MBP3982696.1 hypothetical protein [Acidovorax sp. JG5]